MTTPILFPGFPPGKHRTFTLPAAFVTDLLPMIADVNELKVIVFTFWAVQQREGKYRYARREDYITHAPLMDALGGEAALDHALDQACEHGALLRAKVIVRGTSETLYFINAEPGRKAIAQIQAGKWQESIGADGYPVEILPERPTIYTLYEENIGALTPLIVDALKDAEKDYPREWIEDAIRAAVEKNARHWRFIEAVLKRREAEGKSGGTSEKSAQSQQNTEWYTPR